MSERNRLLAELVNIHTYCRPHGTFTEQQFIEKYVASLPGAYKDEHKNWHVEVGNGSKVLWSCHTDTVHWTEGRQRVDLRNGILRLADKQRDIKLSKRQKRERRIKMAEPVKPIKMGNGSVYYPAKTSLVTYDRGCLGADDGAGVFVLRNMVLRGVPGHYIFHYGEERGGIGSSALARKSSEMLEGFDMAIALDRRGYSDIITHQGGRCCSQAFAQSLADELNSFWEKPHWAPDSTGVYTDTAEYVDDIPECTNISVGYFNAHSGSEELDTNFLLDLLDILCQIDVSKLVIERDPKAVVYHDYTGKFDMWPAFWASEGAKKTKPEVPGWNDPNYDWDDPDYLERFAAWVASSDTTLEDEPWPPRKEPAISGNIGAEITAQHIAFLERNEKANRRAKLEDRFGIDLVERVLGGDDSDLDLEDYEQAAEIMAEMSGEYLDDDEEFLDKTHAEVQRHLRGL